MGCQTGFYLLTRNLSAEKVLETVKKCLKMTIEHDGEMFGAVRKECGNYKNLSLYAAKTECARYLTALESKENDFKYEE